MIFIHFLIRTMSNLVDKINTAGNVLNKDTRMKGRVLGGEPFEEGCKAGRGSDRAVLFNPKP